MFQVKSYQKVQSLMFQVKSYQKVQSLMFQVKSYQKVQLQILRDCLKKKKHLVMSL